MKVVLLLNEQPNQVALAHKFAQHTELAAIVFSRNIVKKPPAHPGKLFVNRVAGRIIGRPLVAAWEALQQRYERQWPKIPDVPIVRVDNINHPDTTLALERFDPDLVAVSGTNLVGKKVIEVGTRRLGMMNLHTGISPYIKGGPNCTNWCLAARSFHLIGSTVMWLDVGIDTGDIVATERAPLGGSESLVELQWAVMEHAHDLYTRVVAALAAGKRLRRIPQASIAKGSTYYNVDWDALAMAKALYNYHRYYGAAYFAGEHCRNALGDITLCPPQPLPLGDSLPVNA